jgi:hypothetical protein
MSAKPEPPQDGELHALKTPAAQAKRKRRSEAQVSRTVAGAMAGEVIAAVAGHAAKGEDKP